MANSVHNKTHIFLSGHHPFYFSKRWIGPRVGKEKKEEEEEANGRYSFVQSAIRTHF
jgi:hypothetical protein